MLAYQICALRSNSRSDISNKIKYEFLQRLPLNRFLAKTLSVEKNCHEKVSQKSINRNRL